MTAFDLVISSGTVYDGRGAEPVVANIGVRDGRIAAISAEPLVGADTIDATGLVVSPGFIDLHSHADYTIEAGPGAPGQLFQGVTTLVTGNCGWSPFPVRDLAELQSWSGFLGTEASWDWQDLAGYASAVDRARPAINLAPQLGHVAVRLAAMGSDQRAPTSAELAAMAHHIRTAAAQGAWGFSSGLIYAPGSFADAAELNHLVAVASAAGLLYSTHMRDESSALLAAVEEAIAAVEPCGGRLQISHLKAMGPANHGTVAQALALLDAARARGVDVAADVYPYTASGTTLLSRLPAWSLEGGFAALALRLADPVLRDRVAQSLRDRSGQDIDWDGVVISELGAGPFTDCVGRSLAAVGRELGVPPEEAALRVLEAHRGQVPIINHAMADADVATVLAHEWVSVASDGAELTLQATGLAHPRSFGTFPRVLGRYVREAGVLGLGAAIRKMTSLPAARLGLADRGVLAVGMVADIAVFDAASIHDRATYTQPWQFSHGVVDLLVAGIPVLRAAQPTAARPGRVLRKPVVSRPERAPA